MDKSELYDGDPDAGVGELDQHDRRNAEFKRQYENLPDDVKREHSLRFGNAPVSQDDLKKSVSDSPVFEPQIIKAGEAAAWTQLENAVGYVRGSEEFDSAFQSFADWYDDNQGKPGFDSLVRSAEEILGVDGALAAALELSRGYKR